MICPIAPIERTTPSPTPHPTPVSRSPKVHILSMWVSPSAVACRVVPTSRQRWHLEAAMARLLSLPAFLFTVPDSAHKHATGAQP